MISTKHITKSYSGKQILKDVSISLQKESISVLFGPSGCGKTTLCRNLSLLEYPDSGQLTIDGISYTFPQPTNHIRLPYPQINMVFQQLFLWPHLTNEQNIRLALHNNTAEVNDRFLYLTELLEIGDILHHFPNESSVGQKQRVAIARVLILRPEFIFFDEITSALDIVQKNRIVKLLLKLRTEGIGILLITHDIHLMKQIADQLLFMDQGSIIETGGNDILLTPQSPILESFLGE